jgi:adenine/guanine phosphoribosyltransferase-like PRPP-binding protein
MVAGLSFVDEISPTVQSGRARASAKARLDHAAIVRGGRDAVRCGHEHTYVSVSAGVRGTVRPLMKFYFPAFLPDSRGNRLEKAQTRSVSDSEGVRLYLLGPEEVAVQLEWVLQGSCTRRVALDDEQKPHWSYRIHVNGGLTEPAKRTIKLLKKVLTLTAKPPLDTAIALDFYKDSSSDEDPRKWKDTSAGTMVRLAKYQGHREAFKDLVEALAWVITEHPTYAAADFVVAVPGHKSDHKSFGEDLAEAVAKRVGKPLVRPTTANEERPAAKEREVGSAKRSLEGEFTFDGQVAGRVLIAVDDVCRSGSTLTAIAAAAKEAGAVCVLGLVGAQTHRK